MCRCVIQNDGGEGTGRAAERREMLDDKREARFLILMALARPESRLHNHAYLKGCFHL